VYFKFWFATTFLICDFCFGVFLSLLETCWIHIADIDISLFSNSFKRYSTISKWFHSTSVQVYIINEKMDLSLDLLENYLSKDYEKCSTRNIFIVVLSHIPQKVSPALIALNKLNTCINIWRLLIPQQWKHLFTISYGREFHLDKENVPH